MQKTTQTKMQHTCAGTEEGKLGRFPFGQPVCALCQRDRNKKRVFVLGVYASAVHAKWLSPKGEELAKELAVASEPCIFWKGEDAAAIVSTVKIPAEAGTLVASGPVKNGPSGKVLDDLFLTPLGLERSDVWLCDLVPWSLQNECQRKAIERSYVPRMERFHLPTVTVLPKEALDRLVDDERRVAITKELFESDAKVLVLLGDEPLRHYAKPLTGLPARLARFGETIESYGRLHPAKIAGKELQVLPLVHPRQAGRLGLFSEKWATLHDDWVKRVARGLL